MIERGPKTIGFTDASAVFSHAYKSFDEWPPQVSVGQYATDDVRYALTMLSNDGPVAAEPEAENVYVESLVLPATLKSVLLRAGFRTVEDIQRFRDAGHSLIEITGIGPERERETLAAIGSRSTRKA